MGASSVVSQRTWERRRTSRRNPCRKCVRSGVGVWANDCSRAQLPSTHVVVDSWESRAHRAALSFRPRFTRYPHDTSRNARITLARILQLWPYMLRYSCGYKLANDGQDTRAIQHYLGHRSLHSACSRSIQGVLERPKPHELCRHYPKEIYVVGAVSSDFAPNSFITVSALSPTLATAASISSFDFLKRLHQKRAISLLEISTRFRAPFVEAVQHDKRSSVDTDKRRIALLVPVHRNAGSRTGPRKVKLHASNDTGGINETS